VAATCCALLANGIRPARAGQTLILEREIPLLNVSGRIDHMALDLQRKRLFVAELGNGTVDVIDIQGGKLLHRFTGLHEPQGVAYLPDPDLVAVAEADGGLVSFFGGSDFLLRGSLDLKDDADNIRLDSRNAHIVVGYGTGALAVIDPVHRLQLQNIALAGHPEAFQLDARSNRAFVNVPAANQIAVVDLLAGRQTATWPTNGAKGNFPMAIDQSSTAIAVVFRSPSRLELLNGETGAVSGSNETCGDADDIFFDPKRHHIYVSCGSGAVDVFSSSPEALAHIARISTSRGARTSLFSPELDRLFVAASAGPAGSNAVILIFRPS
jgi:DNA-binding beta-propeller fold protein YncE